MLFICSVHICRSCHTKFEVCPSLLALCRVVARLILCRGRSGVAVDLLEESEDSSRLWALGAVKESDDILHARLDVRLELFSCHRSTRLDS
jgi:hypothetical protein